MPRKVSRNVGNTFEERQLFSNDNKRLLTWNKFTFDLVKMYDHNSEVYYINMRVTIVEYGIFQDSWGEMGTPCDVTLASILIPGMVKRDPGNYVVLWIFIITFCLYIQYVVLEIYLTLWLMELRDLFLHSKAFSDNPYPEFYQPNS